MIRITLGEATLSKAEELLGQLADRASNVSGGLKNIGEALNKTHRARFESGTAPDGSAWTPLSPWTMAQKKGPGILREGGYLLASMNYTVSGNVLEHGFNTPYAAAQQFGSRHKIVPRSPGGVLAIPNPARGNRPIFARSATVTIPPRPFSGFGQMEEEATRDAIEEWLEVEKL